ncbi:MAG: hypothetical protein KKG59_00345 [Nanoarchaeota archaeon]|nr:hypothetical protein [Nanoarchaeota archaeon]
MAKQTINPIVLNKLRSLVQREQAQTTHLISAVDSLITFMNTTHMDEEINKLKPTILKRLTVIEELDKIEESTINSIDGEEAARIKTELTQQITSIKELIQRIQHLQIDEQHARQIQQLLEHIVALEQEKTASIA